MIHYKKLDFLNFMSEVAKCKTSISALNDQWDNIKLLCEINCPVQSKTLLPAMTEIQSSFYNLQQQLVDTLIVETLNKLGQKMISKAQVAVDILIRNLFERTADVGFLATDDDIRQFVCNENRDDDQRQNIIDRLREYVAKYSVYDEIIILDKDFNVLANLDQNNLIEGTRITDPLLEATLHSSDSFVETFAASPLQSNKKSAHIFSSRIYAEDSDEAAGILCLCFRFENEMKQIFKKLSSDYDGSVIMIINSDNKVIASNDENQVPVGIRMETTDDPDGILYYRGLAYLSKTLDTQGYQEYFGLGWRGHIIIPLNLAFQENADLQNIGSEIMNDLLSKADSFSSALKEIINKTQTINRSLKRIIYNGQIIAKENEMNDEFIRLKSILNAIGKIGISTGSLFKSSVEGLFSTVISTSLTDAAFLASLCIDIMDRNLYERADDCRWWALNSTFRSILSKNKLDEQDVSQLTKVLTYINSLYTVYSHLFIFDKHGRIIAASDTKHIDEIGKILNSGYIHNILSNSRPENYYVSDFEPTFLYNGKPTYIYGASITDPQSAISVGGIGIVFHSEYQFRAMLEDALKSKQNNFAVFTDRNGYIISSTGDFSPGDLLDVSDKMFLLENGRSRSEVVYYKNRYFAVGYAASSSYREYKSTDGYKNDVLAFVFEQLTEESKNADIANTRTTLSIEQSEIALSEDSSHEKLVIFSIGKQLFAFDQSFVLEATEISGVVALPGSSETLRGVIFYKEQCITVLNLFSLFYQNETSNSGSHFLIIQLQKDHIIALEVDELCNVLEINTSDIKFVSQIGGKVSAVSGILCLRGYENSPILLLDRDILFTRLQQDQKDFDWDEISEMLDHIKKEHEQN